MNLPLEFISNIQNTFREDGHAFLKALPDLIAEASARWGLMDVQPAPMLSYNFVAFANQGDDKIVLKMGVPNREMRSEMAALRLFNGEGACRLLDYDEERCWMLLEKLNPGVTLATMEDDEEATLIAAEVMKRIWRSLDTFTFNQQEDKFIRLNDWFDGLKRLRKMFNGGAGPLDEKLVDRAESSARDFFAENHSPVLMHGDFHHYNILSSERGWLVIDPKGVIGPAGYEAGPFMLNPWNNISDENRLKVQIRRRIDILHEHLGFERERILEWSLAHAVLSAWWGIEDNTGWEYAMGFAEMIASL
ncbi:MAG TPA: aminoglycoside phosphotransferase family protein [Anaerolineales bacterium]|nr:aminoglycoside phosphotransferase family protein [Anaerolineales bacterium]